MISELEKMGLVVHTTVFAPPGRGTNRKWKEFFQKSKITFHPVKRNSNHAGEANDNEIVKALQTCTKTCSFALLTSDFDFLGVVQRAAASNKKMFVFIPAKKGRYRSLSKRWSPSLQAAATHRSVPKGHSHSASEWSGPGATGQCMSTLRQL